MATQEVETKIVSAIREHLREDRLPCADVFAIAREHGSAPARVAAMAEALGIRVGWCQLGLFEGAKKQKKSRPASYPEVPPELRTQIEGALKEGRLPCAHAWRIARQLGLERIDVGRAADALGVRISRCQLDCFA